MKLVTEHLGEIILAIAGVALVVGIIVLFGPEIKGFFSNILSKLTEVGTGDKIWDIPSAVTSGSANG